MKKIKGLLYCTKAKPYLVSYNNTNKHWYLLRENEIKPFSRLNTYNGTIPCECEIEVEEHNETTNDWLCMSLREKIIFGNMCEKASIDELECYKYANGKPLYAIHIKNLHIFDEPRELSEYVYRTCLYSNCSTCKYYKIANCSAMQFPIKKANIMYAFECIGDGGYINLDEVSKEPYILISIKPQELCRILNGEQTILIKKKVLNCMKGNLE